MRNALILSVLMFILSFSITSSVQANGKENRPDTKNQKGVSALVESNDSKDEEEDSNQNRNQQREETKAKEVKKNKDIDEALVREQRRSQVANAVHQMLEVADRVGGIGEQVRVVAQSQQQNHQDVEDQLDEIKERSGFTKFFIGPKYNKIEKAKDLIEQDKDKINKLEEIKSTLTNEEDKVKIDEQISIIKEAISEVEDIIDEEQSEFSLFGWLAKIF